jgi:hypothetical protein
MIMDIKKSNTRFLYMTAVVKFYKNNWKRRFFEFLKIQVPGTGGCMILIFPSTRNRWLLKNTLPDTDYCPSRKYFDCPSFTRPRESACSPSASRLLLRREFRIQSFCNSFIAVGGLLFDKKKTTAQEKTEEDFNFCVFF